jgi:hypothetical protein
MYQSASRIPHRHCEFGDVVRTLRNPEIRKFHPYGRILHKILAFYGSTVRLQFCPAAELSVAWDAYVVLRGVM